MNMLDLLVKLESLDTAIELKDGSLKIDAPKGVLTPLLLSELKANKNEIIKFLEEKSRNKFVTVEPVEKKEYYPLSSAQKRLYFLQQMDKNSPAYNIPSIMILEGIVDKNKLEQSITKLIRGHESLRTSIELVNEEPVQRIHDHEHVAFEIEYYNLPTDYTDYTNDKDDKIHHSSFIIHHFIRAFDLSKAPLLRVGLIEMEKDRHIFLIDMHHIISDGMSTQVLVQDFSALYAGKELPEIKLQYKGYAEWQNREKVSKKILEQGEYWKKEYGGEIPVLELPTDYARPAVQGFEGNSINFEINKETAGALKALALEAGATLYIGLLALYTILLSKLSNQEDIVIGTPVAGRRHADLEKIIGMFVNTLALRNYPSGENGFMDFLGEVKEIALKGFENQEYQYEDLVEQIPVNRDTGRNPLFDTMFVLQNTGSQEIKIPGLKLVPYEFENKTSKFDLTLTAVEVEEKLVFCFEYSTKLFKRETIEQFIIYFKNIVRSIVENKNRRISNLEILTEEEKKRILFDFNDTEREYPKDKTIHQLFEEQVERTPDNIALHGLMITWRHGEVGAITYKELNEKSKRLGGVLIEKGAQPDTIVGIMMERSVEMIAGIMGILKAGGAYLPIDPQYPQERINYMLKDSG
ncbi:MAG: AMP-binding protein, partial [Candidatus Aminicenantes bacterium]